MVGLHNSYLQRSAQNPNCLKGPDTCWLRFNPSSKIRTQKTFQRLDSAAAPGPTWSGSAHLEPCWPFAEVLRGWLAQSAGMRCSSGHLSSSFSSSGHGRPQARRSCTSVHCSPWAEDGRAARRVCPRLRWPWTWWTTGATSCRTTSWSSFTTTAWWVHVEERQRRCALVWCQSVRDLMICPSNITRSYWPCCVTLSELSIICHHCSVYSWCFPCKPTVFSYFWTLSPQSCLSRYILCTEILTRAGCLFSLGTPTFSLSHTSQRRGFSKRSPCW